jgi:S-adenosylmethionine-diacylglycerol 3-amino-3-carboxypropyl transferase
MPQRIEDRARFDLIRYANCWEDADVLCSALEPAPGRRVLSIASGGDNSFALAAAGAEVVAADLSPAQLALCELKRAALRWLDHEGLLAFLGITRSDRRVSVYAGLREALPASARDYWDARPGVLAAGVVHGGKFEDYFRLFRTRLLPLIHGRRTVAALLEPRDEPGRRAFYDRTWNNLRWRLLFRVFFSRRVMGRLGRDPEFFRYVEGPVSDRILSRAEYALTALAPHENPYLQFILNGNYGPALPRYLRPENFAAVRAGLDRLTFFLGPVEEAVRRHGAGGFDGFNLSDIFEYLPPDVCRGTFAALLAAARPGARLAYWNMLAPRSCPAEYSARVRPLAELAAALFARDLAFFYSRLVVEEVV